MDTGKAGPGQQADDLTANKELRIHKNRYLFVTDQSRHLPLAVTLTVDQSHLHEILAALANSRLRFQTTQVEFRRTSSTSASNPTTAPTNGSTGPSYNNAPGYTQGSSPPPGMFSPSIGGPPPGSSMYGPPGGKFGPPMPPSIPDLPPNIPGSTPGSTPTTATAAQDNPNLIEVTIYGIASLYERPRQQQ
jgi:hypothetical protein